MKHNKVFVLGMLAVLLAFGFCLVGCPMDDADKEQQVTGGHTATEITPNKWWEGDLSTGGEMWIKFTAGDDTKYFHFSPGLLTGIAIQMLDSSGNEQGSGISLGYYSPYNTVLSVSSGSTYYIKITGRGSGSGTLKIGLTRYSDVSPSVISMMASASSADSGNWLQADMSANGAHWLKFTATSSTMYVHFEAGGLTGVSVQVRKSTGEISGSSISLGYYSPTSTTLSLLNGSVYYLEVGPRGSGSGTYEIKVTTSSTP